MCKASNLALFAHEPHTLSSDWVLRKPLIIEGSHLPIKMTAECVIVGRIICRNCQQLRQAIVSFQRLEDVSSHILAGVTFRDLHKIETGAVDFEIGATPSSIYSNKSKLVLALPAIKGNCNC